MKKHSIGILGICTTLILTGCYFFPEEEALLDPPTIKVEDVVYSTYTAKLKTIISTRIVTGYVYSKTSVDCFFTDYTGQIKTIYPKVGDMVNEGDLIAEMNTGTLEYDLKIQRLKVNLARTNYNNSGSSADKLQLEIEENTLLKYEAEYNGSKVFAPISGQVSFVDKINPGDEVNPYKVLVTIINPDDLYVKATVSDATTFTLNDNVTIKIGDDEYNGVVTDTPTEARARGDENLLQISAEFVDFKPSFALLGNLADVTLVKAISENAVVIPKTLVQTLDGRTFLRILEDGVKKEVDVTVGISNATEIEITSGLKAGEQVIVK